MIKRFTVLVVFVVLIASGLFFRQILDLMYGMTVLEMLQRSVEFVLHVIVVSIAAYALYQVNELAQPWIKTFQQKQRHHRRQIRGRRTSAAHHGAAPVTRSQKDRGLLYLLNLMAQQQKHDKRW